MKVSTNRPAFRFQQVGQVTRPVARSQRRVRRDFGIRPQPGAGVPSGSRFGRGFDDRFTLGRDYRMLGAIEPQISEFKPRVINRFGSLGIGETEKFLLQTAVGGLAAFGGSFFGAQAGVQSASKTGEEEKATSQISPALFSLLSDTAKAAGLEETAKTLAVRKAAERRMRPPLSTTAKVAIGAGGAGALALLFLL